MSANAVQRLLDGLSAVGRYPHFRAICLLHDDARAGGSPSFEIDFINRVGIVDIYGRCRSCGANTLELVNALGLDWPDLQYAMPAFVAGHPEIASRPWPLPRPSEFAGWSTRLLEGGEALDVLLVRGISLDVIEQHGIGYDEKRRRIMFPIVEHPAPESPLSRTDHRQRGLVSARSVTRMVVTRCAVGAGGRRVSTPALQTRRGSSSPKAS